MLVTEINALRTRHPEPDGGATVAVSAAAAADNIRQMAKGRER